MKYFRGFTLIELLIAITMLAVIATASAPFFIGAVTNQKLKAAAIEIKNGISEARSRALLTRSSTVVCPSFNTNADSVDTCGSQLAGYSTLSESQKKDSVIIALVSDRVSIKSGSDDHFQFNNRGLTTVKSITLCGYEKSIVINVFIPGTMTLTEGAKCI